MLLCRQPLRLMDYPVSFGAQTPALGGTQAINTSVPYSRPLSHFSWRDTMSTSDTEAREASETFHGFNRLQIKRYEMEKVVGGEPRCGTERQKYSSRANYCGGDS